MFFAIFSYKINEGQGQGSRSKVKVRLNQYKSKIPYLEERKSGQHMVERGGAQKKVIF